MPEIWSYIPDTDNKYMASNLGRIKNANTNKVLKSRVSKGYQLINIQVKGKPKTFTVHRLIAITFIPNPFNKREINHKDEDKSNNSVDNLMWCTSKENSNWGTRKERIANSITELHKKGHYILNNGEYEKVARNTIKIIKLDIKSKEVIESYNSVSEAARLNNIGQSNISDVLRGARNQTGGYAWKYSK